MSQEPMAETLQQHRQPDDDPPARPDVNGSRELPRLQPGGLPPKDKVDVVLFSPATNTRRVITEKLKGKKSPFQNGRYKNEKYEIDVPIKGSMAWNNGTEIWIDVDQGIQIDYNGIDWTGPDGVWAFRAQVKHIWSAILAAKNNELIKWAKIVVVLISITLAVLLISVIILSGNVQGGG